mmetsp:Transcript_72386/g.141856  ORF Transcript_72386/g.141856 Transcript_72386/m.141856 type:complete len:203 (-) Transcript_72386:2971-3579(-)
MSSSSFPWIGSISSKSPRTVFGIELVGSVLKGVLHGAVPDDLVLLVNGGVLQGSAPDDLVLLVDEGVLQGSTPDVVVVLVDEGVLRGSAPDVVVVGALARRGSFGVVGLDDRASLFSLFICAIFKRRGTIKPEFLDVGTSLPFPPSCLAVCLGEEDASNLFVAPEASGAVAREASHSRRMDFSNLEIAFAIFGSLTERFKSS